MADGRKLDPCILVFDSNCNRSGKVLMMKRAWTEEEDAQLRVFVHKYGAKDWSSVRERMGIDREGTSCQDRWNFSLKPGIKKGVLTEEEKHLVLSLQAKYGNNWVKISEEVPGRTRKRLWRWWYKFTRRKQQEKLKALQGQQLNTRTADRDITMDAPVAASDSKRKPPCNTSHSSFSSVTIISSNLPEVSHSQLLRNIILGGTTPLDSHSAFPKHDKGIEDVHSSQHTADDIPGSNICVQNPINRDAKKTVAVYEQANARIEINMKRTFLEESSSQQVPSENRPRKCLCQVPDRIQASGNDSKEPVESQKTGNLGKDYQEPDSIAAQETEKLGVESQEQDNLGFVKDSKLAAHPWKQPSLLDICNELEEDKNFWFALKKESESRLLLLERELESEKVEKRNQKCIETEAKIQVLKEEECGYLQKLEREYVQNVSTIRQEAQKREARLVELWIAKHVKPADFLEQMQSSLVS